MKLLQRLALAALSVSATTAVAAQSLEVAHIACVSSTKSFGEQVRILAHFAADDGRIFLCSAEIPISNTAGVKIESVNCRLWRSPLKGASKVATTIFRKRFDAETGLCGMGFSFQADLKSNQARACALEVDDPTEICMTAPLQSSKQ
jgi:hypothetical protein